MSDLPWSDPRSNPLADIKAAFQNARTRHDELVADDFNRSSEPDHVFTIDDAALAARRWTLPDFKFGGSVQVSQEEFDREERRHQEWRQQEQDALDRGVCPFTSLPLYRGGEAGPEMLSCDMCDCFGYDPEEVPNPVDPLTCDREMLYHWKGCLQCECPPEAYHAPDCPASPIYAAIMAEGWLDTRPLEMNQRYWPLHWICVGLGGVEPHRGADINGPTHWCEREKRVVSQDEW